MDKQNVKGVKKGGGEEKKRDMMVKCGDHDTSRSFILKT